MEIMRAFLGIFPPKEIAAVFRDYRQQLRKQKQNIAFVPAPDIHLSLKFLGPDVSEKSIADITEICRNIVGRYKPFEIELSDVRFGFGHASKPRILFASIVENKIVNELAGEIESAIPRLKFPDTYPPRGKFVPHFTLGRIRGNIHQKKIQEILDAVKQKPFEGKGMKFVVDTIRLVNSIKVKDGQRYEVVEEFRLKSNIVNS